MTVGLVFCRHPDHQAGNGTATAGFTYCGWVSTGFRRASV